MNQTTISIAQQERGHALLSAPEFSNADFGFLQELMNDNAVEEIWINRPGEVWFADQSGHHRLELSFSELAVGRLLEQLLRSSGRRLDASKPFVDARLADGSRLHAVIPNVAKNHTSINIRKFRANSFLLAELIEAEVLSVTQAAAIRAAIRKRKSVLFAGATHSGKTTLLSACLNELDYQERVVSVEDTFEINADLSDWVALQTRDTEIESTVSVDLRRLVRESLRMRPTRLVVGEVRGSEAQELLIALNSGIPAFCTIHANSAADAFDKLVALALIDSDRISEKFARKVFKSSIGLIVHCVHQDGVRRVHEVVALED